MEIAVLVLAVGGTVGIGFVLSRLVLGVMLHAMARPGSQR
jgi:hypothetical protein